MIKAKISIVKKLLPPEKFFVEKALELLHSNTLDTYRLRINNPKTILHELIAVIDGVKKGSLRETYIDVLNLEALELYKKEKEIKFISITKGFFIESLTTKDYDRIYYAANLILSENRKYVSHLYHNILQEISRLSALTSYSWDEYSSLNRLIQFFFIELRKQGYSKKYLYNYVVALFGSPSPLPDFTSAIEAIKHLVERELEVFKVFYAFKNSGIAKQLLDLDSFDLKSISKSQIEEDAKSINEKFIEFIEANASNEFYYIEQDAVDYYTAGALARKKLQKGLDMLFMATDDDIFNVHNTCFVYGTRQPNKGKTQILSYKLDGNFEPSFSSYKKFLSNYKKLDASSVDQVTITKIYSALRYLRFGTLASEQEHKLLNYWIAIEYLFSGTSLQDNKIHRLILYFKKSHANSYVRRLFLDLHNSIIKYKITPSISNFNKSKLSYLFDPTTDVEIEAYKTRYPLLYFRYHSTKKRFENSQGILSDLKRHSNNVEWNLNRIYRTRNEIVHSAATDIDVIELASHLKYFLVFTLNGLFNFLISSPVNASVTKALCIDDYFLTESIKCDSLMKNDRVTAQELIRKKSPVEYLQKN